MSHPNIMAHQRTQTDKALDLVRKAGIFRPRELKPYGIPRVYLSRLCAAGKLRRIGRGLYVLPDSGATEHRSLAEACKRVPKGVVCLLSALRFHGLTTQAPFEVWLAIGEKDWRPRLEYPLFCIARPYVPDRFYRIRPVRVPVMLGKVPVISPGVRIRRATSPNSKGVPAGSLCC